MSLWRNDFYKDQQNATQYNPAGKVRKKEKLDPEHPGIEKLFLEHCEMGWSPGGFAGNLKGSIVAFTKMLRINKACFEINERFKRFPKGKKV
jgi:hypothetical protein